MSNKVILSTNDNGLSISFTVPAKGFTAEFCVKDIRKGHLYKIVDESLLPLDRTFRNAWEVTVDETWSIK